MSKKVVLLHVHMIASFVLGPVPLHRVATLSSTLLYTLHQLPSQVYHSRDITSTAGTHYVSPETAAEYFGEIFIKSGGLYKHNLVYDGTHVLVTKFLELESENYSRSEAVNYINKLLTTNPCKT